MIGESAKELRRVGKISPTKLPPLVIGRDPNEVAEGHDGYTFETYRVEVIPLPLGIGDYTIIGMEELVRVERKALKDMVASLGARTPEFLLKADELGQFRWGRILAECRYHQVAYPPHGYYPWLPPYPDGKRRGAHPSSVRAALISADIRGSPVIWAGNRSAAEWWLVEYFRKLWGKHWEACHEVVNGKALG